MGGKGGRLKVYQVGLFLKKMLMSSEWRAFASRMAILVRGTVFFPGDRFATTIYAPIFEVFLPLCLGLARPEADKWVMPKLAACASWAAGLAIRSSGGRRQEVGS